MKREAFDRKKYHVRILTANVQLRPRYMRAMYNLAREGSYSAVLNGNVNESS